MECQILPSPTAASQRVNQRRNWTMGPMGSVNIDSKSACAWTREAAGWPWSTATRCKWASNTGWSLPP
eukprot:3710886-Lingulodinium_polyedra.AAC.1